MEHNKFNFVNGDYVTYSTKAEDGYAQWVGIVKEVNDNAITLHAASLKNSKVNYFGVDSDFIPYSIGHTALNGVLHIDRSVKIRSSKEDEVKWMNENLKNRGYSFNKDKKMIGDVKNDTKNMKILGFSKETYTKKYLDSLNDKYLNEIACEDDMIIILEDIKDFQDYLNSAMNNSKDYWWYFI